VHKPGSIVNVFIIRRSKIVINHDYDDKHLKHCFEHLLNQKAKQVSFLHPKAGK